MTTHHDPGHGFVCDFGDGFEMTGVDLGRTLHLTHRSGTQQLPWMTPDQARELAAALTVWADHTDARPPLTNAPEPPSGATELALFEEEK